MSVKRILVMVISSIYGAYALEAATTLDIGTSNNVSGSGIASIGNANAGDANNSVIVGQYHYADAIDSSLSVGNSNFLIESDGVVAVGSINAVTGNDSITSGYQNINAGFRSLVLGRYNIASQEFYSDAVVFGRYGDFISKAAFLVVGNGISGSVRQNAFVVYQDGDVIVTKRQGDVSMGIYGN